MTLNIAILLSGRHGRGSTLQAICEGCADGRIDGRVVLVVGNFVDSPALERARGLGLRTEVIGSPGKLATEADIENYGYALLATLLDAGTELICLAGYLLRIPANVLGAFPARIMNVHPALLPAFGGKGMYGARVHQAVVDYGVKVSGCTVHFIDEEYDTGPIILQSPVPVYADDTADDVAARVLVAEHETYVRAVGLIAEGRVRVEGRRVVVA